MSDFVTQDMLPELWNEIVKRHWAYFDTEESIVKLEKRKQLEDCLKEFLCIVQHDRKFFLPETAKVLKNSIRDLEDFSAQKAITAFESISQYANNLFTKPWRKEFRILKMYSGFYQHEIKSNLLDAEKLFEAMGYRRLSDDTLILDGPICPDQVTNVSRDAMTAYVELQIIKHIYTGLDTIGINCSWMDIFRYREKYTGGTSQAVKALAYSVEEKRFRSRQKALAGDNYGYIDVQPSSNYFASTNTQFCPAQCQCNLYQPVSRHRPMAQSNGMCCVPEHHQQQQQSSRTASNLVYSNMAYPAQHHYQHNHHHGGILNDSGGVPMSQMSHSRSLEHYTEPANHHHSILPHRHSFDHQQQGCTGQHHQQQPHQPQHYYQHLNQQQQNLYESPYDCIDGNSMGGGSSTISYAAVAANAVAGTAASGVGGGGGISCNLNSNSTYSHPYNVSGNRFPLPLNISNQLSAYDNIQSSNYVVPQEPTYAHIADQHMYSSVSKLPQNCMLNSASYNQTNHIHGVQNPSLAKDSLQRQRSYQQEQLINFEDPSIMPPTTPQQFDPLNQYRHGYEPSNHLMDKRYNMGNIMESPLAPPPASSCQQQQHYVTGKPTAINDDMYVYAKPTPRENRKPLQNAINVRKSSYNSADRGDTTDISYESANDDFINLPPQENERNHLRSPTQFTKNQEGVGSFESWNYVFQNLERSGYSKDLGEREDFLVKSLDLDSLNINNDTSPSQSSSAEKRRSNYAGNDNKTTIQQQHQQQQPQLEPKQKSRTFENSKYSSKNNTKMEITASASSSINGGQKQKISMDNNTKKIKSALKQTNETSKSNTNNINPNHHPNKTQPKINDNKTPPKTMNNNNNDSLTNTANGSTQRKKSSTSTTTRKTSASVGSTSAPPNATQIIVTSPSEWSCSFCTFLNPNTKRICEMCCRSKDFNLDSSTTSTAAGGGGGTSVAHNTTTCA
ncbi:protein tamozhennic [Lucilia sericata]|uniref:protein tamozhennic n=1 Tax=Lucilia sericata TaxID=13632 RepID=UPI0018A85305|nr:protein tamozhennic [Lucilia sericata]